MAKLKFKSKIVKSFNKSTSFIKMSKHLSAKYFQENKERLQKISKFLKKKKKKNDNMVVNVTKISQETKRINWLNIEINIIE